jgi:tetratricopeptide (TPR) repeat protein
MRFLRLACFAALVCTASASPRDKALGKVVFPSSCSTAAQPLVTSGVALLHSFQYQQAKMTFQDAAKHDPQCAIAYWGQAMSLYHQIWDFPQAETLKQGRGYVAKAEKARHASPRERAYIATAKAFFSADEKLSHLERAQIYSSASAGLSKQFPDDVEAAAFYALSLISRAEDDDDHEHQTTLRKQAIALLNPLFRAHPDHPGLAHYMIHATDTTEFAAQGLEAARSYAQIAPDSSHAIHMPSHIFVRLGLWPESIASNIAANQSGARAAAMHLAEAHYQTHAMDFLNYSYLQSGQERKAHQVIAEAQDVVHASDDSKAELVSRLSERTVRELHRWKEAAGLPVPNVKLIEKDSAYRARVIGKARLGDTAGARAELEKLKEVWAAQRKQAQNEGYPMAKENHLGPVEVWLLFSEGKHEEALKEMRAIAERDEKAGVDSLSIPAREQLADMLLELKRPMEAAAEYKQALIQSPNRFNSLFGAAHSLQLAGNATEATVFYSKLLESAGTSGDRPELAEARAVLENSERVSAHD